MMSIGERITILVVEDDPFVRLHAVDLLEELGFATLEARDADDAIRILEGRTEIGILFTDIDMPGSMDGLALAKTVRDRWPPVKVIIASVIVRPHPGEIPATAIFFPKPYGRNAVAAALAPAA